MGTPSEKYSPLETAVELVHVAEVALQIPEKWNAAVIEVREIDAGAEHASVLVFGMFDHVAAQHGDFDRGIEQSEIDAGFHAVERGLVLGVEEARIFKGNDRRLSAPCYRGTRQSDRVILGKFRKHSPRLRPREQHGVTQMPA